MILTQEQILNVNTCILTEKGKFSFINNGIHASARGENKETKERSSE